MIEHEGLSDRRSSSRFLKFRLGRKAMSAKGKEYPEKLDHFRADPEDEALLPVLHKILGEKPKRLRIMFVTGDREQIFPQYLKKYGKSGLLCKGTGGMLADGSPKLAIFRVKDAETGEVDDEHPCNPTRCEDYLSGRCKRLASLCGFILCDFPGIRTCQIDTTSKMSIENLNSRFDDLERLVAAVGRPASVAGIPLVLTVKPVQVKARDKDGKPLKGKQTVYVMDLDVDTVGLMEGKPTLAFLGKLAPPPAIEAPDEARAPEGLYPRSEVEARADPVAERIEATEEAEGEEENDTAGQLPDDILEGIRMVGLTKRQVRNLIARFASDPDGELTKPERDNLFRYLSGLVDLRAAGDHASLGTLKVELAGLNLDEPDEEPEEEKAEAEAEEKPDKLKKSAGALGLDI